MQWRTLHSPNGDRAHGELIRAQSAIAAARLLLSAGSSAVRGAAIDNGL